MDNKKYKLEYLDGYNTVKTTFSIDKAIGFIVIIIFILNFIFLDFLNYSNISFIYSESLLVISLFVIIIFFMILFFQHPDKIKKTKKRERAYIISADSKIYRNKYGRKEVFYIKILYNGRVITIGHLKNNYAHQTLKSIIHSTSEGESIKIPIDVYVGKYIIYADLDTVDFTEYIS